MTTSTDNANPTSRARAAGILKTWLKTEQFPDRLIKPDIPDRAFVVELVNGSVRWKRRLEWMAEQCSNGKISQAATPYLLVGFYQLFLMDDVPPHAAVSETVEAAKHDLPRPAVGFVNALLRRALREKDSLEEKLQRQSMAVQLSHPDLLVQRWSKHFGHDRARALCERNNTRPLVAVTPRAQATTLDDLQATFEEAGVAATPHAFAAETFLVLPRGTRVPGLPGLAEGLFNIQDPSTSTSIELLDPRPNERILDACAAPGGKAFLICDRTAGKATVVAMDVHTDRLRVLKENMKRLRFDQVQTVQGDAASGHDMLKKFKNDPFDRILLDVPCTNTGVLQRRSDARWRFNEKRLRELLKTQRDILDATSTILNPGGTLVYSTCSLEPEEGEEMVISWLADHSEFECVKTRRLFPPETETDGVFAAALRRQA